MNTGRSRFFWRLFLANALLLAAVGGTCIGLILYSFDRLYDEQVTRYLKSVAQVLRRVGEPYFEPLDVESLQDLAQRGAGSGEPYELRVTMFSTDGRALADSVYDARALEGQDTGKEFWDALVQEWGHDTRHSEYSGYAMKYEALLVGTSAHKKGVVRVATGWGVPLKRMAQAPNLVWWISVVVLAAAVVLALGLAQLWSGPIARITATAQSLSQGDLSARAPVRGSDEVALLGQALNQMRDRLAEQLETIDHQRRTLEQLLAQLHEGVVVAGADGRLLRVNPAAARLLGLPEPADDAPRRFDGMTVTMLLPDGDLRVMLTPGHHDGGAVSTVGAGTSPDDAAAADTPLGKIQESRVTIEAPGGPRTLLARASDIVLPAHRGPQKEAPVAGRLLVLTNITELTRTLQVQTDFVTNASHELRTPLSTIRAAVETLMTLDWTTDAAAGRRIIGVIDRHSARLETLVAELLELTRIEGGAASRFPPSVLRLPEVFRDLFERFATALTAKKLHWDARTPRENDTISVNPGLLNLVLDNLVNNAIKFTREGGSVGVRTWCAEQAIHLCVEDNGCGIPEEEQGRVFERFYQVERARTGKARGTGLGLSIVRHAVNAMKGSIRLESRPGEGTRITVTLPQPYTADARP